MVDFWIFQANPDIFDLDRALRDLTQMTWTAGRYAGRIRVGDWVFLWRSGEFAGIVGLATVTHPAVRMPMPEETARYAYNRRFRRSEPYVWIQVQHCLAQPLYRSTLKLDQRLAKLTILRYAAQSVFSLPPAHSQILLELVYNSMLTAIQRSGRAVSAPKRRSPGPSED